MIFHCLETMPADEKWTSVTAAGVVVLSFEGVILRLLDLSQWTILLVRGPLMAVGLGVIFWLGWGRGGGLLRGLRATGGWGLLAAALFACDNVLFVVALRSTSVANTLLLLSTAPVFAGALGRPVLGERVPARTWVVTATVLCGGATSLAAEPAQARLQAPRGPSSRHAVRPGKRSWWRNPDPDASRSGRRALRSLS